MRLENQTKTIGGEEYEASQLLVPQGLALLEWLMKKVGPGLQVMYGDEASEDVVSGGIFKGVGKILEQLSGTDLMYLYDRLADTCTVGGVGMNKQQIRVAHFQGRYGEFVQWLMWMLDVNFKSFFSEMGALSENAKGQALPTQSASPSQTE